MRLLWLVLQNKQGIQEDDTRLRIGKVSKNKSKTEIAVLDATPGK